MVNKKILVIGGEGYVGSVVIKNLLIEKYNIYSIDNLIYNQDIHKKSYYNDNKYEFAKLDIRNSDFLKKIDFSEFSSIIVFAGLVGDPITKKYPEISKEINENSIIKIINHCMNFNLKHFIFISTCSNYGFINEELYATEEQTLNPLSNYSKSKVKIENYLNKNSSYINYTILRFATAFGLSERMRFDLTLNEFTKDIYLNNLLDIYDPDTWRPYCHVNDFANLISIVLSAPTKFTKNQIFNAGGNQNNFTKRDIIKCISKYIDSSNSVKYLQKGNDPRNYKVDFSKVKNMLGFIPKYSLDDGVREIINEFNNGKFENINKNKFIYGNYSI